MQIYKFETSATTAGGTVSINTLDIIGGIAKQIYIKAASTGTLFAAKLTDERSRVVREYDRTSDFILDEDELIMQGVYTFQITDGSHDQQYDILVMLREN